MFGQFYHDCEFVNRWGDQFVYVTEKWNTDQDNVIKSAVPMAPSTIAKIHGQGTQGIFEHLANKMNGEPCGSIPCGPMPPK